MLCAETIERSLHLFPQARWDRELPALARQYSENVPVPHVLLADFLRPEAARAMAEEFPSAAAGAWTHYKHHNEDKLGMPKRHLFPPNLGRLVDELNSPQFLGWLAALTGIPGLIADQDLEGGGLHQSGRGGFLNLHTDFSHHHYRKDWLRRINLILYLSPAWREEWGGSIELWDGHMQRCVKKYPPLLNRALIFNTDERSYHGFPEPLQCPEAVNRNSLALYYYTVANGTAPVRSTNYRARPSDGICESALIWLDKKAVHLYSRAKARVGFSDEMASRILRFLSKRKPAPSTRAHQSEEILAPEAVTEAANRS